MNVGMTQQQIDRLLPYFVEEVTRSTREKVPIVDLRDEASQSIPSYSGQVSIAAYI